jgi:SPP1 gp7 family putative phage head morphogenesis protein
MPMATAQLKTSNVTRRTQTTTSSSATSDRAQRKDERVKARERFQRARKAELQYGRQLRSVAKQVGSIIRTFAPKGEVTNITQLTTTLERYSEMLKPWARTVAERMLTEVAQRDETAWLELGRTMGRELKRELRFAPTGEALKEQLESQVNLITSLPLDAARRVHKLTLEALTTSARAEEVKQDILRSGHVTASRAMLIARTEVARTASTLTKVRAEYVGSVGYLWRTSKDVAVRLSHKQMEGQFVRWDEPPTLDQFQGHAGTIPNCRCWPEPVIPDKF